MGTRGWRAAFSIALVAAGLTVVGVVNAPNALADCGGSTGDSCGATKVIFGVEQLTSHFGETLHIHGFVNDDSAGCFASRFACHVPNGKVTVTDQTGQVLGISHLAYSNNEQAQWGFHWLGPGTLLGAPPSHEITIHTLPAGNYTATATYTGEVNDYFDSSSSNVDFTVLPSASDVVLTQSNSSTLTGQSTKLTATVTGVFNGVYQDEFGGFAHKPDGAVIFYEDGEVVGPALLDANGVATIDAVLSDYGHGFGQLFAEYVGSNDFDGDASAVVAHSFSKGNTSIGLSSPTATSVVGLNYPVTAHVAAVSPASGVPTGSVTFKDTETDTTLGTIALDGSGDATIQLGGILGSHSIVATYNGSGGFNVKESSALTHTVVKGDVNNGVSQNKASTVFGEPFNVAAGLTPIAPATAVPTGSITFGDADAPLATVTVVGGQASTSISSLTVGSHVVTADYSGDGAFNPKRATITHVVTKAVTTTSLTATGSNPTPLGSPVTYTATVAVESPGAATPTGTVQFFEGSVPLGSAVPLSGNTASITTVVGGGTHSITAKYNGDQRLRSSTSDAIERTAACDQTVTGTFRAYTATPGGLTCMVNAKIRSTLTVPAGAALFITGSQINGVVKTTDAAALMVCGTTVNGAFTAQGTTGWLVFGAPPLGCGANLIKGRTLLANNHGGVLLSGTTFRTSLACTGNSPAPVNGGNNTIRRGSGQCATPGF